MCQVYKITASFDIAAFSATPPCAGWQLVLDLRDFLAARTR
jgi:hypothetical protein